MELLGKVSPFNEALATFCWTPNTVTLTNAFVSLYCPLADAYKALSEAVNCSRRSVKSSVRSWDGEKATHLYQKSSILHQTLPIINV